MSDSLVDIEARVEPFNRSLTNISRDSRASLGSKQSLSKQKSGGIRLSALLQNPFRASTKQDRRFMTTHSSVLRRDDRALLTWSNLSFFVPLTSNDKKDIKNANIAASSVGPNIN